MGMHELLKMRIRNARMKWLYRTGRRTAVQLAEEAGISRQRVYQILNGQYEFAERKWWKPW